MLYYVFGEFRDTYMLIYEWAQTLRTEEIKAAKVKVIQLSIQIKVEFLPFKKKQKSDVCIMVVKIILMNHSWIVSLDRRLYFTLFM